MPKTNSENKVEKLLKRHSQKIRLLKRFINTLGVTIFILSMLELMSALILVLYFKTLTVSRNGVHILSYNTEIYKGVPWARDYFKEFSNANSFVYTPYLNQRKKPNFQGKFINIDENSNRITPFQCPGETEDETIKIFFFGGSTVWGDGVRDTGTIPAVVAQELCKKGYKVEVTNFGESGFTSTQDLFHLQLELKKGNTPDLAIFYGGYNDVFSSYQNKKAGLPQNNLQRIAEFNLSKKHHVGMLPKLKNLISRLLFMFYEYEVDYSIQELANNTAENYLHNAELAKSLSQVYGFDTLFIWQPSSYTKEFPSESEKKVFKFSPDMETMYNTITETLSQKDDVLDYSKVFDSMLSTLYIDYIHLSEGGNSIVAKKISEEIVSIIDSDEKK